MPKNPNRPKIKYKPVKKPPRPPMTREEKAAKNLARLEDKHRINPQLVSATILKERGLLTGVCRRLKINRTTLRRYIDKHPECQDALNTAREAMGDKAEGKLFELIDQGDVRCLLYYLSTIHKNRGYGLNGSGGEADHGGRGPMFVEQVNIIAVPSGTFIPKPVVEHASNG